MKLTISPENKMIDIPDLNKFRIGERVVCDATPDYDRHEGVIVGIELSRAWSSSRLEPSITIIDEAGYLTDGFKPSDLCRAATDGETK